MESYRRKRLTLSIRVQPTEQLGGEVRASAAEPPLPQPEPVAAGTEGPGDQARGCRQRCVELAEGVKSLSKRRRVVAENARPMLLISAQFAAVEERRPTRRSFSRTGISLS